jgi:hypothetical protein
MMLNARKYRNHRPWTLTKLLQHSIAHARRAAQHLPGFNPHRASRLSLSLHCPTRPQAPCIPNFQPRPSPATTPSSRPALYILTPCISTTLAPDAHSAAPPPRRSAVRRPTSPCSTSTWCARPRAAQGEPARGVRARRGAAWSGPARGALCARSCCLAVLRFALPLLPVLLRRPPLMIQRVASFL